MTIYSVVATSDKTKTQDAIKNNFAVTDYLEVHPGFWLVSSSAPTPRELSEILAPNRDIGTFFISPIIGYYGFHNQTIWNWLAAKGI